MTPDRDNDQETEPDEKLALMHSLDLEQLKVDGPLQQKVIIDRSRDPMEQQHEELAARFAATVAAVAAAAAAANARDREREADTADPDRDMDMEAGDLEEAPGAGTLPESSSAAVVRP